MTCWKSLPKLWLTISWAEWGSAQLFASLGIGGAGTQGPESLGNSVQNGYGWSDGSMVIHRKSVNSLITARPSNRP